MEIWETIIMKLSKEKLQQIIKEEIEKTHKGLYDEGLGDIFTKDTAAMAAAGALAGLPLAMNAIASGGHPGIALPLIAMANGAVVGVLTDMVAPGLLNKAAKVFKTLGGKAKEELKDLGKKIGLSESSELTEETLKEFQTRLGKIIKQTKSDEESGQMEESKIKLSKEKLNQIVQEELQDLMEVDADIAAALMGRAGLPRSSQETKVDRPVTPQELGPEDDPEREEEELPQIPQEDAIEAFIEAFIQFPQEKQDSWQQDEKRLSYVLNQFIRSYRMDAIEGSAEDLDNIWNALNESKLTKEVLQQFIEEAFGKSAKHRALDKERRDSLDNEKDPTKKKVMQLRREIEKLQSKIQFEKNYIPNDRFSSDERKSQARENIKAYEAVLAKKQKELSSSLESVSEAWTGDPEIEQTGQYSDKSTEELCAMKSKLMKKEKRTDAEQKKVRQINFAIRSKQKGPKFGKVDC